MNEIEKAQQLAEHVAIMVAQYYDALLRNRVPKAVAERLAMHYQEEYFKMLLALQSKAPLV